MKGLFSVDSPAMIFLKKFGELLIANLLWALCSIPIVTIGAATTALYYVCFKVINHEDISIGKAFFRSFRENFKQSTAIWLVFLAVLIVTVLEISFVLRLSTIPPTANTILLCVFGFVLLAWFLIYIYAFAFQAYFDNTIRNTVRNAVIFGISYYGYSILMIVADAVLLYIGLLYAPIVIPVLPVVVNAYFMQKIFARHIPAAEPEMTEEGKKNEI